MLKWPSASGMCGEQISFTMRFSPFPFFKYMRVVEACASTERAASVRLAAFAQAKSRAVTADWLLVVRARERHAAGVRHDLVLRVEEREGAGE